jgi:tRNA-specific 2-thiouridylase
MSGGVDSSVAALILKSQGYEVIGLFMRTGAVSEHANKPDRKKGCCSAVDAGDARRVADQLNIPFYALDFEQDFTRIIDYFSDEYLSGRTPNPCVVCNNWLKFGRLWSFGQQLNADCIATGHYARIVDQAGCQELHRARDDKKDQSYVLFGLKKDTLARVRFPIGELKKDDVRQIARKAGLAVADKPDSVEICFVPDGQHAAFISQRHPDRSFPGQIVDTTGRVVAEHQGIEHFTIGQRKGLGFAAGRRRFVLNIVPEDHRIVIGDRDELLATGLIAKEVNWLIDRPMQGLLSCRAKIRYRHKEAVAQVTPLPDGKTQVHFHEPQTAITPGQAVVFYDDDRVLGGGWIESACAS